MKQARVVKLVKFEKKGTKDKRINERRFIWIPGIKPVKMPANTPAKVAMIISRIMKKEQIPA
ncbi:MAG: hypothetical protein ACQEP1_06345 [Nanobdellota archaeon]